MGELWDTPNTDSEPAKARWLAKRNPEEMPHKSDSNYHEGVSLWACTCIYPHGLPFFLLNTTCFTTFCLYEEIPFCTADRSQSCHWPLVLGGLVARIQHPHWLQISGQKAKPCLKPLEATQGQNHPYTIHMKLSVSQWTNNLISYYAYVIEALKKHLSNSIQRAWPFQTSPYVPFHLAVQIYSL